MAVFQVFRVSEYAELESFGRRDIPSNRAIKSTLESFRLGYQISVQVIQRKCIRGRIDVEFGPSQLLNDILFDLSFEYAEITLSWSKRVDWVDWDQTERDQQAVYRHGIPALNALEFDSLLGGISRRLEPNYSVQSFGIPIHDLDCISTICLFSTLLLRLSLSRQGIFLREQQVVDDVALWRLVAYLLPGTTWTI
ncbi:predicted protein [Histoplasma capsulatum H143]|uniref:Uncharacterized protein n=1 Tax=Ajellomyces capsulatus (strain H143) TaxID=544712 RepID=C6HB36_AJECH|nr:predicted protein [Histoplasma capsulatum H143]